MAKLAKVSGELIVKDGSGWAPEFYEAEFTLPDSVGTLSQARAVIQAGLIHTHLQQNVENYKRWRTCQVDSYEDVKAEVTEEQDELTTLLVKATEMACLPENIDNYKRPDYKIKALQRAIEVAEKRRLTMKEAV